MIDFFISYNKADELWATGIGDWLDQAGYSTVLQAQDFVPGANFVSEMHRALQSAKRVMLVLSPDYLTAKFPEAEWTAAFAKDPTNENKTIIPVRVRTCEPPGLLKPIVYIDLVGLSVVESQKRLLAGITSAIRGKRRSARKVPTTTTSNDQQPNQTVIGSGNYVAGRDFIMYHRPPAQKLVVEPLPGSISIEQRKQVHQWIETLAEGTMGKSRSDAYRMWWSRFKMHFGLAKYEDLPACAFGEAETWYRQQAAIGINKLKMKAPDVWRNARYGAIKSVIRKMGIDKADYYYQASARLKIRPFTSLKDLTKRDLDRVYRMALRDSPS